MGFLRVYKQDQHYFKMTMRKKDLEVEISRSKTRRKQQFEDESGEEEENQENEEIFADTVDDETVEGEEDEEAKEDDEYESGYKLEPFNLRNEREEGTFDK